MATRIRLQRHGKKGKPFFHIVVADQRAKRDGRFIEKLGTYNPNTNPASIDINFDRCVHWVTTGAQPSDTARAILSYKGVLMKEHLLRGVAKGALTEAQAETKFNQWLESKASKIENKKSSLSSAEEKARKARLEAEREVNAARAAALAAQAVEEVAEEVAEVAEEAVEAVSEVVEEAAEAITPESAQAEETEEEKQD